MVKSKSCLFCKFNHSRNRVEGIKCVNKRRAQKQNQLRKQKSQVQSFTTAQNKLQKNVNQLKINQKQKINETALQYSVLRDGKIRKLKRIKKKQVISKLRKRTYNKISQAQCLKWYYQKFQKDNIYSIPPECNIYFKSHPNRYWNRLKAKILYQPWCQIFFQSNFLKNEILNTSAFERDFDFISHSKKVYRNLKRRVSHLKTYNVERSEVVKYNKSRKHENEDQQGFVNQLQIKKKLYSQLDYLFANVKQEQSLYQNQLNIRNNLDELITRLESSSKLFWDQIKVRKYSNYIKKDFKQNINYLYSQFQRGQIQERIQMGSSIKVVMYSTGRDFIKLYNHPYLRFNYGIDCVKIYRLIRDVLIKQIFHIYEIIILIGLYFDLFNVRHQEFIISINLLYQRIVFWKSSKLYRQYIKNLGRKCVFKQKQIKEFFKKIQVNSVCIKNRRLDLRLEQLYQHHIQQYNIYKLKHLFQPSNVIPFEKWLFSKGYYIEANQCQKFGQSTKASESQSENIMIRGPQTIRNLTLQNLDLPVVIAKIINKYLQIQNQAQRLILPKVIYKQTFHKPQRIFNRFNGERRQTKLKLFNELIQYRKQGFKLNQIEIERIKRLFYLNEQTKSRLWHSNNFVKWNTKLTAFLSQYQQQCGFTNNESEGLMKLILTQRIKKILSEQFDNEVEVLEFLGNQITLKNMKKLILQN